MSLLNITPTVPIIYDSLSHGPWTTNHTKGWLAILIVFFLLSVVCGVVEAVRGNRIKDVILLDAGDFSLTWFILFTFYCLLGLTVLGGLVALVYIML